MSLEQILLLAVAVVLPLIQLLRAARKRDRRIREQAQPTAARRPAMRAPQPAHPPLPHAPTPPQPKAAHGKMPAKTAEPKPKPARDADKPLAPEAGPNERRNMVLESLSDPRGLRRAIVLMTILGPCRAIHPND